MKVERVEKKEFVPFTINIKVESQEEEQQLYNIFNHAWITESAGIVGANITNKLSRNNKSWQDFDGKMRKQAEAYFKHIDCVKRC
jgi:hypothetical protein